MKEKTKKWKGKDWYAILAPKMFNEAFLAETPTYDVKSIIGRNVEVSLAEIINNPQKYYIKLKFKIKSVDGKNALTDFSGSSVINEYLYRIVRKKNQKVETIIETKTKDGWKLQLTIITILNRNTNVNIQKRIRSEVTEFINNFSAKSTLDDFVKAMITDSIQRKIKKFGSKTYPVRFDEVTKIDVLETGVIEKSKK